MIIAATGHRPDKLGGYSDEARDRLVAKARAYLEREQPDQVVSGMALGWDTAWALAAVEFRVYLVAALPCDRQHARWPLEARRRWEWIVARANRTVVVSPGPYEVWKMQRRNEWMVDHCDKVCAMWNGDRSGGTFNCVEYAAKMHKPVDNLWEREDLGL